MQHESPCLALQNRPGITRHQCFRFGEEPIRHRHHIRAIDHAAALMPHRIAMLACNCSGHIGQQRINLGNRPTGDNRQCTVHPITQGDQHAGQIGRHQHTVRRGGNVDQRAVKIEQQTGPLRQRHAHRQPANFTS